MNKAFKLFTSNQVKNIYTTTTFLTRQPQQRSIQIISSRSFHSSSQTLYLFDNVLGKIKNIFSSDKDKTTTTKEYPTNEKDLEDKTNNNLKSLSEISSSVKSVEQQEKQDKENEEYQKILMSGKRYDFNIFRDYIIKYASQIKDQTKIDEINNFVKIIDKMTPVERENPLIFRKNAFKIRARLIKESGTDMTIFSSFNSTFTQAKQLHDVLGSFKRKGREVPYTAAEIPSFFKKNAEEIRNELNKITQEENRRYL
ncbi:hypothetical protein RB653_003965 [Dictyostelium firmibasis]|uniref:Uncharacterized protein n=1 Tax=Dictyostelium firmibasis TaxID=79012 RepID=A0AAN7YZL6_9MYCE